MKKRIIIIFIIFILLIFPIKNTYKDGGTVTYTSLTYKIICWKIPINIEIIDSNDKHINRKFFETTKLYLFPFNFMKMNWYKEQIPLYDIENKVIAYYVVYNIN